MSAESSFRLLDYLEPGRVVIGLGKKDKRAALEEVVALAAGGETILDVQRLLDAVLHRENVVSTGIGNRVAIPHADLPEIEAPRLAIGVFPEGIDFQSMDEEPVKLVFLLLGTPRSPGLHTKILARIARLSKDPEFADLEQAQAPSEVLALLERIEARHQAL